MNLPTHAKQWLLGLDMFANAIIGGVAGETISSRAGKGARKGILAWCLLCRVLDAIDKNHCEKSIQPNIGKPVAPI